MFVSEASLESKQGTRLDGGNYKGVFRGRLLRSFLERALPPKSKALAVRGEGFARCLRKRVLAFGESVLRNPPLPSTYEQSKKYFSFRLMGFFCCTWKAMYWPRKRTYRSLTNVFYKELSAERFLNAVSSKPTVRCILINIILPVFECS